MWPQGALPLLTARSLSKIFSNTAWLARWRSALTVINRKHSVQFWDRMSSQSQTPNKNEKKKNNRHTPVSQVRVAAGYFLWSVHPLLDGPLNSFSYKPLRSPSSFWKAMPVYLLIVQSKAIEDFSVAHRTQSRSFTGHQRGNLSMLCMCWPQTGLRTACTYDPQSILHSVRSYCTHLKCNSLW